MDNSDNGIHIIDLVRYILGEITEVYGAASANVWKFEGSEDNGFAMLHTDSGKVAQLQASWTEWRGYRFFIEAYGDRGMARASYAPMFSMAVYLDELGSICRRKYSLYPGLFAREKLQGWKSTVRVAFTEELQDFVRCQRQVEMSYSLPSRNVRLRPAGWRGGGRVVAVGGRVAPVLRARGRSDGAGSEASG